MRNVLKHIGILAGAIVARKSRWLDMPSDACFGFAEEDGLVEPLKDLGDAVQAGEVVARIHPLNRTGAAPVEHSGVGRIEFSSRNDANVPRIAPSQ